MNFFAESAETSIRDDGKNTTGWLMGWYIIGFTTLYDKLHNSYPLYSMVFYRCAKLCAYGIMARSPAKPSLSAFQALK